MEKNDLVEKNPLRALGLDDRKKGSQTMGLVIARAGLGKTAILVQFALDCMLLGNKVLHVSIGESMDKTRSWYDDILSLLTDGEKVSQIPEIMHNRMIMTFKETNFNKIKFEERLNDLVQQNIFKPDCMIIDGYDFVSNDKASLQELQDFMTNHGVKTAWFSAICHRGDPRCNEIGVPAPCHEIDDLFGTILLIKPEKERMNLNVLKCDNCAIDPGTSLVLDPSTMLIHKG